MLAYYLDLALRCLKRNVALTALMIVAIGFGIALLGQRRWKLGTFVIVASVIAFLITLRVIIPAFAGWDDPGAAFTGRLEHQTCTNQVGALGELRLAYGDRGARLGGQVIDNMRLFAATVMPELKKFDAGANIDRSSMLPDPRFAVAAE